MKIEKLEEDTRLSDELWSITLKVNELIDAHNESQEPKPCDHSNGICNPENFPCNQFVAKPQDEPKEKCANMRILGYCYDHDVDSLDEAKPHAENPRTPVR